MKTKKTSLADIAYALGVSKTLVSMVLNGKGDANGISKKTQEKVLELAKKLNYKPNQFARGLRMGRSHTIGLIVSDISNVFYSKIARYVEDKASTYDYNVIMCSSDENADKELKLAEMLLEKQVDGLILSPTHDNLSRLNDLVADTVPMVLIDRTFNCCEKTHVIVDNIKGASDVAKCLADSGHRNIALFTITPTYLSTQVERREGFKKELERRNIHFDEAMSYEIPFDNINETICSIVKEWKSKGNMPTALFTANNLLALGCLECFRQNKVRVPQDISLVSFDDIDLFRFSSPSITAVAQPVEQISHKAVDLLMDSVKNTARQKIQRVCLKPKLQIRESVVKLN